MMASARLLARLGGKQADEMADMVAVSRPTTLPGRTGAVSGAAE
jgi:hypothetical protein